MLLLIVLTLANYQDFGRTHLLNGTVMLNEAVQRNAKHEAKLSNIQLLQFIVDAGLPGKRLQICPGNRIRSWSK
jgi:hypothetical protein